MEHTTYTIDLKDNEVFADEYCRSENITPFALYYRLKNGLIWRYGIPERQSIIIIEKDTWTRKKSGRKKK
jgi:hypothetical protein